MSGWPLVASFEELCARLEEVVQTLVRPAPAVPLRAVAAVMAFQAAHRERRTADPTVLAEALQEAFPSGELPAELAARLAEQHQTPEPHRRRRGARRPRRHFRSRPPSPERR